MEKLTSDSVAANKNSLKKCILNTVINFFLFASVLMYSNFNISKNNEISSQSQNTFISVNLIIFPIT